MAERTLAQQYADNLRSGDADLMRDKNPYFTATQATRNPLLGEEFPDINSYEAKPAAAGTTFSSTMQDIRQNVTDPRQQLGLIESLYNQGYFKQFADYDKRANRKVGQSIASGQAAFDDEVFGGLDATDIGMASVLAAPALAWALSPAAGAAPSAATGGSSGAFTGGLNVGPGAAAAMGTGGGAAIPAAGLNAGAAAPSVLGAGGASAPASGLFVSPQAMSAFNAGINLPFAAGSGITAGGAGMEFAQPATSLEGGAQQVGGLKVGPDAATQMGVPATPGAPAATSGVATPAPGAAPAAAPAAAAPQQMTFVDNLIQQMKNNALQLGLMGTGLAIAAGGRQDMPSEAEMQGLSDEARKTAKQLMGNYRAGQLSASQQASLQQLTQQTKNQITQYFSSIGQADSTAHMQALAQVDQQSLAMKQQMLDNMLQQGLSAIGVATGPLNSIAQYQLGQDQALRQAFGSFAGSVGTMIGRNAGTQRPPAPQPTQTAPVVSSARA